MGPHTQLKPSTSALCRKTVSFAHHVGHGCQLLFFKAPLSPGSGGPSSPKASPKRSPPRRLPPRREGHTEGPITVTQGAQGKHTSLGLLPSGTSARRGEFPKSEFPPARWSSSAQRRRPGQWFETLPPSTPPGQCQWVADGRGWKERATADGLRICAAVG